MKGPLRVVGFDALFLGSDDPWDTWADRDERNKRASLLRACGHVRGRALELGCGNGSNTAMLQNRALRLLAVDGAASAVSVTRNNITSDKVSVQLAILPRELPRQTFDLVVIAEILYYLTPREIECLASALSFGTGSRLVLAHHHVNFSDTSSHPATVHSRLITALGRAVKQVYVHRTAHWRVEAFDVGA